MKINIYYFVVGVLSILFSFTHALNGFSNILSLIDASTFEVSIKMTIFYVWHIITVENLIFGIAFLVMSFYKDSTKVEFAAWIIAAVILARWAIIFGTTLFKDIGGLQNMFVDSVAIIIYVGLIVLGIKWKDKSAHDKMAGN